MAQGNPRLLAWSTDDTLRLYEFTGSGFTQIGSTGASHSNTLESEGIYPTFGFVQDDSIILVQRCSTESIMAHTSFDEGLSEQIGSQSRSLLGIGRSAVAINLMDSVSAFVVYESSMTGDTAYQASPDGSLSGIGTYFQSNGGSFRSLAFSNLGDIAVRGGDAINGIHVFPRTGYSGDVPQYANVSSFKLLHEKQTDFIAISHDSRFIYAVERGSEGAVHVFKTDGEGGFDFMTSIVNEIGTPWSVAPSPDGRTLAISFLEGSTYRTIMYRRYGDFFAAFQTIDSAMGRVLGFSADGKYLFDANAKRAFQDTGAIFEEIAGAMSAVAGTVMSQAVSGHMINPLSRSFFYRGAVPAIVGGSADMENLRLLLLSEDAVFNPADTNIDTVTNSGTYEVYQNTWPMGGLPVTVEGFETEGPEKEVLAASDVAAIIIEQDVSFRYAVISEGDIPRIFIDPLAEQTILKDRELRFSFPSGLVAFEP